MTHKKLSHLRELFTPHTSHGYGWLESRIQEASKKIILVHGVTGGKEDMLPLAIEYEKQGYHVYCLDLPGHGDSAWTHEVSFASLAEWLAGFIKLVGEPEVLVSNSFSSAVVYAYVQRGLLPARTHVILGCPTPDTSLLTTGLYRLAKIIPMRPGWYIYTTALANGIRTVMATKKLQKHPILWLIESERRKRATIHPHAGVTLSTLLFVDNPYQGPVWPQAAQERTTVILGTKDNVVTRHTAKLLHKLLPHATHVPAHGAGHILHFEAVDDVSAHPRV